jgi:hypothetical protein
MAYGVSGPKAAVLYTADDDTKFLERHTNDVATAGGFTAGFGEPHPGKGRLIDRHIGLHSGTFHTHIPIATQGFFDGLVLGQAFSYAGKNWQITSKVGEKVVLR